MLNFIVNNLSTIVVAGLVIALVGAVSFKMLRDKKKGGNCSGCACHCKKQETRGKRQECGGFSIDN